MSRDFLPHHMQIDARLRRRAEAMQALPGQVDQHVAAMRPEGPTSLSTERSRLRGERLAQFRQRYRTTYKANEHERSVYFAKLAEIDAVKIGYARDPEKRMKGLFSTYGIVAEVVGTIWGDQWQERRLHELFRRARVHHRNVPELFAYSVIKDAIAALVALQPEFEEVAALPRPPRTFNSASFDATAVEVAAKRMLADRQGAT